MAFAAPLLSIAGGAIGAIGELSAGARARAQGEYQAAILSNRAVIADENARRASEDAKIAMENARRVGVAGQVGAQDQDFAAAEQIGSVVATQGASGVTGASQSRVRQALDRLASRDRARIITEATARASEVRSQAGQFQAEATSFKNEAAVARTDADMTKVNAAAEVGMSRLSAFGSLVGGAIGAGEIFLDPRRTAIVRDSFNNLFRRRSTA